MNKLVIVIVADEFNSHDLVLHTDMVMFNESPKLIAHTIYFNIKFYFSNEKIYIILP